MNAKAEAILKITGLTREMLNMDQFYHVEKSASLALLLDEIDSIQAKIDAISENRQDF